MFVFPIFKFGFWGLHSNFVNTGENSIFFCKKVMLLFWGDSKFMITSYCFWLVHWWVNWRIQRFTSVHTFKSHLEASDELNAFILFSSHLMGVCWSIYMLCQSFSFPNIDKINTGKDALNLLLQRRRSKPCGRTVFWSF